MALEAGAGREARSAPPRAGPAARLVSPERWLAAPGQARNRGAPAAPRRHRRRRPGPPPRARSAAANHYFSGTCALASTFLPDPRAAPQGKQEAGRRTEAKRALAPPSEEGATGPVSR